MRLFALLALVVLLAGCGSSGSDLVEDDEETQQSGAAVTATPVAATATPTTPSADATPTVASETDEATANPSPTATAEPSPTPAPTNTPNPTPTPEAAAISVVSQGFGQEPDGREVGWAFVVENPNPGLAIENSEYQIAVMDEAGTVLEADSGYINLLLPGERTAYAGSVYLPEGATAASIDVSVQQGDTEPLGVTDTFTTDAVSYLPGEYRSEVSGIVSNPFNGDFQDLRLSAVAYDAEGAIVGAGFTFLNFIPAQGQTGATVSVVSSSEQATVELYASITSLTILADSGSESSDAQPLVLAEHGFGQQSDSREVGWGFVVENPNQDSGFENSIYRAVAYDESGVVVGADSGYITQIKPGQRLGFGGSLYVAEGRAATRLDVQVLAGDPVSLGAESMFTTENVAYLADEYLPKVTGVVKNVTDQPLEDIRVSAIAYDEAGQIIGGGFSYVDFVPAQGQAAAEVSVSTSGAPARVELHPTVTSLTMLAQ